MHAVIAAGASCCVSARHGGIVLATMRVDMPATAAPVEQHWRTGRCGVQREPGALQRSHAGWELSNTGTKLAEICSSRAPPQPADYVAQPAIWLPMAHSYKASVMPCSRHQHLSHRRANNYLTLISCGKEHNNRPGLRQRQHRPSSTRRREPDPPPPRSTAWMSHIRNHALTLATYFHTTSTTS